MLELELLFQRDQTMQLTHLGRRRYQGSSSFQCDRVVQTELKSLPQYEELENLLVAILDSYLQVLAVA